MTKTTNYASFDKLLIFAFAFLMVLSACNQNGGQLSSVQKLTSKSDLNAFLKKCDELKTIEHIRDSLRLITDGNENDISLLLSEYVDANMHYQAFDFDAAAKSLLIVLDQPEILKQFPEFHLRAITLLIHCFELTNQYEQGLQWIVLADGLENAIPEDEVKLQYNITKASFYKGVLKYQEALSITYEVINHEMFNNLSLKRKMFAYNLAMMILNDLRKFEDAITVGYEAIKIKDEATNHENLSIDNIYNNLSIAYVELKQFDKAIEVMEFTIADLSSRPNTHNREFVIKYYNLGSYYLELDSTDSRALQNFEIGLDKSDNYELGIAYNSYGIGAYYLANNNLNNAEKYLLTAEEIFRNKDNTQMLYSVLQPLIKLTRKKGQFEQALRYYDEFLVLENAYHEYVLNRDTEELTIKHAVEKTKNENDNLQNELLLKRQNEKQKNLVIWLMTFLSFSAIIIILILIFSRKKLQKAHLLILEKNNTINAKNDALNNIIHERDALVKTIIHDLRNPLSSIQGFTHLLEEENSEEEKKIFLNMLNSSSNQLDVLISSLLSAYKNLDEIPKDDMREVKISDVLKQIIKGFEFDAKYKEIAIHTKIEPLVANTDKASIYSIFGNLISNAIKFSPKQKSIYIELHKNEDTWSFLIRDEGPGFSQEDQQKMFSMFKKLSAAPTSNENSTGIGLYSVKKTIHRLNGKIILNTDYKDGAEFVCIFPVH